MIKVVFTASECSPIAKVGGLADVVGSLPKALTKLGIDVKIVIPKYGIIDTREFPAKLVFENLEVFFNHKLENFNIWKTRLPNTEIEVFLVEHPILSSNGIYLDPTATPKGVTEINRFAFFSEVVVKFLDEVVGDVNIIHCNDWHTGIIPDLIKVNFPPPHNLAKVATVLTIHNLGAAYQGVADPAILYVLDLDFESLPQIERDVATGYVNFLQQGIESANILTTVSPAYAAETQTQEFGGKLAPILQRRRQVLYGILNGIDYEIFNPKTDKNLVKNYDLKSWVDGKRANKNFLAKKLGLKGDNGVLIGMVTRLDEQKGLDLVFEALPKFAQMKVNFVILGKGDPKLEARFWQYCQKNPANLSCNFKFDPALASLIYAGADLFLMPSRFEPCGLGQMIAMFYGTLPVVRDVGGLHDTVEDGVTGFKFGPFTTFALVSAVERAITEFKNKNSWVEMVETAMTKDFSWDKSAVEYVKLYEKALKTKKGE